tara:strand:- start:44 stop:787 length:744 start_codon:yes stop_codon:yes gene_type:complete
MGGAGSSGIRALGLFAVLGAIAALVAFVFYTMNKKKPCVDFTCPDGKTNRVNSKGNSIEECCYTATPGIVTPIEEEEEEEPTIIDVGKKKKNVGMIVGAAVGGVLLLLIIGFSIMVFVGRKSLDEDERVKYHDDAQSGRVFDMLTGSRLSGLAPAASGANRSVAYFRQGVKRTAAGVASLYDRASTIAKSAIAKPSEVAAADALDEAAEVGEEAGRLSFFASSNARSHAGYRPTAVGSNRPRPVTRH